MEDRALDTPETSHDGCCAAGSASGAASGQSCPACGTKGRAVKPITIDSLVTEEARRRVGRSDGFRFCPGPECEVAYYHPETGDRISKHEVRVRIGKKESEPPRPVCYCFDHTVEEIEAEVAATGTSRVAEEIAEKCRQGLDRCPETNPQGHCCLKDVRDIVDGVRDGVRDGVLDGARGARPPGRRAARWTAAGAVVSAMLSSACCWLPLLLIAFGASAAGVAGFLEAYRPIFLAAAGVLLAVGFYLVYGRRLLRRRAGGGGEACCAGATCSTADRRLRRFNAALLWVTTAFVLAFALFPSYIGSFLGGGSSTPAALASGKVDVYHIEGMTCEACAVTLRSRLEKVPGVLGADVSFEEKIARVAVDRSSPPPAKEILDAVRELGYSVSGDSAAGPQDAARTRENRAPDHGEPPHR